MFEITLNRFLNSRGMVAVCGIIMLVAARMAFMTGDLTYIGGNRGLVFPSLNLWVADHWLEMVINTGLLLIIALGWMFVLQIFNPMRAMTSLPAAFFLVMSAATPDLLDQLYTGTALALAVMCCLALLWPTYMNGSATRNVFLIFAILSSLTMTQYAYAIFIPVFFLGLIQMKILSVRTLLAMALGLVTPWWIVFGAGFADFNEIHLPEITNFFKEFDITDTIQIVVITLTTTILLISAWTTNVMKVITLNANLRAFNGSLSMTSLFTLLAIAADFTNAATYLPLLYLLTAYQLGYSFVSHQGRRSYIGILFIVLVYIGFYLWSMMTQN